MKCKECKYEYDYGQDAESIKETGLCQLCHRGYLKTINPPHPDDKAGRGL
ncbi:hypothetical protein LCGC14_1183080 [marine sediment metagenome]|uniref:Uncharacterized protein n=1 Tax=marine sediment metagenome TaxID=412755 RepID=A0A0F9PS15_9ZZZZ